MLSAGPQVEGAAGLGMEEGSRDTAPRNKTPCQCLTEVTHASLGSRPGVVPSQGESGLVLCEQWTVVGVTISDC